MTLILLRDDFASSTNREGSCKDVGEIELKEGLPAVKVQRGPKSYTPMASSSKPLHWKIEVASSR